MGGGLGKGEEIKDKNQKNEHSFGTRKKEQRNKRGIRENG